MSHKIVPFLALFVCLALIMPALNCAPRDPLTETVIKADLIALGTITDNRTDVVTIVSDNSTGKRAYTIFTLSVEKVIKGNPDTKEVLIKVEGGPIGEAYQVPTGAYFAISDRILALLQLKEDNIYTIPYAGIVWFESTTTGAKSIERLPDSIGRIAKNMLVQDIPIAMDETISMPAGPVKRPDGVNCRLLIPRN